MTSRAELHLIIHKIWSELYEKGHFIFSLVPRHDINVPSIYEIIQREFSDRIINPSRILKILIRRCPIRFLHKIVPLRDITGDENLFIIIPIMYGPIAEFFFQKAIDLIKQRKIECANTILQLFDYIDYYTD